MLSEITTSQSPNEPHRRWFSDEDFDLVIWFDDLGAIAAFQLCYDRSKVERALVWSTGGFRHYRVDTGESTPLRNLTPILVSDGEFSKDRVIAAFLEAGNALDPTIRSFVAQRLQECPS